MNPKIDESAPSDEALYIFTKDSFINDFNKARKKKVTFSNLKLTDRVVEVRMLTQNQASLLTDRLAVETRVRFLANRDNAAASSSHHQKRSAPLEVYLPRLSCNSTGNRRCGADVLPPLSSNSTGSRRCGAVVPSGRSDDALQSIMGRRREPRKARRLLSVSTDELSALFANLHLQREDHLGEGKRAKTRPHCSK